MSKILSDWQAAGLLNDLNGENLDAYLIYKGCVAFAINGQTHSREVELDDVYRRLLQARRDLKNGVENSFAKISGLIPDNHPRHFEMMGDLEHILGSYYNRVSQLETAAAHFDQAAVFFRQGHDSHRTLRSQINAAICRATTASHAHGDLFFLKQRANREGFYDLVGNISKAAVSVWLVEGNFNEALRSSQEATAAYSLDGCPEDRAVSQALLAISQLLMGQLDAARISASSVSVRDGKVKAYLDIVHELLLGKSPQLPTDHHLAAVAWKIKSSPKDQSIPGQIINHLKVKSRKRDELIELVWGSRAIDTSYCARLHTAINELRHKYQIEIEFDGETYGLTELKKIRTSSR